MMQLLPWILIGFLAVFLSLRSFRWGLILYLIIALIFPAQWFGELSLRFELVYLLWLVFVFFMHKSISDSTFVWHSVLSTYVLFLMLIILSTTLALISNLSEGSLTQLITPFYGILRPLLVLCLFLNAPVDEKFPKLFLWAVVWLNIPIALLSLGQSLRFGIAQEITLKGYTSPWRTPVFFYLEEGDQYFRSVGVFESPIYNAIFSLIVLVTIVILLVNKYTLYRQIILYISFSFALLAGITTSSSTFILGLVVISGFFLIFFGLGCIRRFYRIALAVICVVGILFFITMPQLAEIPRLSNGLHYQAHRIQTCSVFESRYDSSSGAFANTFQAIIERPILGWGLTKVEGAFVGDSIYIVTLYRVGMVGLALWLFLVILILKCSWSCRKNQGVFGDICWLVFLITLLLSATGVGAASFFLPRIQEWYWALVGISLNPNLRETSIQERKLE
ncbi:MAG: hypothetical protein PHN90_05600 [Methanothrix sp.]|nr:hypothetical protein [Methanothrix sp.]